MVVGKFSDHEWWTTLVIWAGVLGFYCPMSTILYYGFFKPMAVSTARSESEGPIPPAYGFWVRGNTSFFAPGIMNRTDLNASSGTYMHWIPPPGTGH